VVDFGISRHGQVLRGNQASGNRIFPCGAMGHGTQSAGLVAREAACSHARRAVGRSCGPGSRLQPRSARTPPIFSQPQITIKQEQKGYPIFSL
jgi:hypothetical protein